VWEIFEEWKTLKNGLDNKSPPPSPEASGGAFTQEGRALREEQPAAGRAN
jgi:hypothetical protein